MDPALVHVQDAGSGERFAMSFCNILSLLVSMETSSATAHVRVSWRSGASSHSVSVCACETDRDSIWQRVCVCCARNAPHFMK